MSDQNVSTDVSQPINCPEQTQITEKPDNYEPLAVQKAKQSNVDITDDGLIKANTIEGQYRVANAMFESKMVPKSYESASQVMAGMQYAVELGLRPLSGLRNIAMINGSPSLFGELPLALCRKTGQVEWIREYIIDKDYKTIGVQNKNLDTKPWAGVCELKRKGEDWVYEGVFTLDEAKDAGLLDKKFTPWHTYPKIMLMRRARSMVLKQAFAEALQGVQIAEYDNNYIPAEGEIADVTHRGEKREDVAKILNEIHN